MTSTSVRVATGERGFSLIELMIAMICTTLVGAAILAVLVAGQNAFRREPALAERTQNIRLAMSLIQKDIAMAGNGMGRWAQVFTPNLNGVGPSFGTPPPPPSDYLQVIGSDGQCPAMDTRPGPSTAGDIQTSVLTLPACYAPPRFMFLQGLVNTDQHESSTLLAPQYAVGFVCPGGTGGDLGFPPGQAPPSAPPLPGGAIPATMQRVVPAQMARYEIRPGPAPEGIPELWRSASAGVNPSTYCGGTGTTDWQMVARGIYDMQVTYLVTNAAGNLVLSPAAGGNPAGTTPPVIPYPLGPVPPNPVPNYLLLVRAVTVTLVARTVGETNIAGYDPSTGLGPLQTLTTTTSPRTAQVAFIGLGGATEWE